MTDSNFRGVTKGTQHFDLFQIRSGVPIDHAFTQLSTLLDCIRHLTTEAEMEHDQIAGSAARILSEMAKALIDDIELGGMAACDYVHRPEHNGEL